ncbi:MAG TPA: ArsA-related P-loop ATPase [Acidimicrobiales bacterium]|jgi:anion-transporting  ArsA/GET3 family ATPase
MEIAAFCRQSRVVVVAGKGGVGKSTVVAALGRMAADAGLSVLIVELEGRPGIGEAFGGSEALGYDESDLYRAGGGAAGGGAVVRARRITPDDALLEYLADHGLRRVSKRLVSSGVLDIVATAIPGIRDVLVLGKVKRLEQDQVADLVVLDAPATGHAVTFLTSARGLLGVARGGPVRTQATEVAALLADPARCQVILVTLPEEMPVSETIEAAYLVEDRAGVRLGPVVVNGLTALTPGLGVPAAEAARAAGVHVDPAELHALEAARLFRLRRAELQAEQVDRLARELPLPQLRLPALLSGSVGPAELAVLADALAAEVDALAPELAST